MAEIEKRKRAKGRGAKRVRDMGLQRHGKNVHHVDNGPLARKLGAKVKAAREAIEMSVEALAKHVGGTPKWVEAVESGRCMPSQEACHRFVRVLWGRETWRDQPFKRGLGDKIDPGYNVRVTIYDENLLGQWHNWAESMGTTLSAIMRFALERLFNDSPTLTTIAEGVKEAERLRAQSILESMPEMVALLRGDPLSAQMIHLNPKSDWKSIAERDNYTLAQDVLLADGKQYGEDITTTGPA